MVITGVTLTGADDSVEPTKLLELSKQFPFVEWGILIGSRAGVSRFPSYRWLMRLRDAVDENDATMKLSLHICGEPLRNMLEQGALDVEGSVVEGLPWKRSQLNFHGEPITLKQAYNCASAMYHDWFADEIIVQLDGENDWFVDALKAEGFPRISGLYDKSHGGGVLPDEWPKPNPHWEVGYAGGLGPENVGRELQQIAKVADGHRFWIDMETRLYSADSTGAAYFDPRLCRCVLAECAKHFPTKVSL